MGMLQELDYEVVEAGSGQAGRDGLEQFLLSTQLSC